MGAAESRVTGLAARLDRRAGHLADLALRTPAHRAGPGLHIVDRALLTEVVGLESRVTTEGYLHRDHADESTIWEPDRHRQAQARQPAAVPAQAAARECDEEIGLDIDVARLELLGIFEAAAANEADHLVRGTVYLWPDRVTSDANLIRAAAEIDELRWIEPHSPPPELPLAPLLAHHVLPRVR